MSQRARAPRRAQRHSTTVPDILFCLAAAAWTMALIFLIASFLNSEVTSGEAGRLLARLFAGALFASGLFVGLLGLALLRDDRAQRDHYFVPVLVGVLIGGLEAYLFLVPIESLLWAPFLLLVLAIRPVRTWLARRLHLSGPA